jgi:hypothetical protein
LRIAYGGDERFGTRAIFRANKCDRRLQRDADFARAVVGGEPEIDVDTGCGIAPVTCQLKAVSMRGQANSFESAINRSILKAWCKKQRALKRAPVEE